MLKILSERWAERGSILKEQLSAIKDVREISYTDLVHMSFSVMLNDKVNCRNPETITVIDYGDYQGTLMFIIPFNTYQPSESEVLMTFVGYGSCSVCDTLQAIIDLNCDWSSHSPSKRQVQKLLSLCKDIIMNTIKPYNYGWRHSEDFEQVEMEVTSEDED